MVTFKTIVNKSWVFILATALITGSSSAMAYALDRNVPTSSSVNAISITDTVKETIQTAKTVLPAEYSVIDLSKSAPERKELIKKKLSMINGITPEQIEEKSNAIIASLTPGDKDISAEQAAAYAADILKKAYGMDFTDYTAEASFSRSSIPDSDNWTVIFRSPEDQNKDQERMLNSYIASVNSVSGTMLNASFIDPDYTYVNKNLNDPVWVEKAEQAITALLPENVTITSSKVISALPVGGVTVVSELSDGSACSVRLKGEGKKAVDYIAFPNGYDGSLDFNAVKENALG